MTFRVPIAATRTAGILFATCLPIAGCGDGPLDPPGDDPSDPTDPTVPVFVEVASGSGHTCALDDDGVVWCWGRNLEGQLGLGDTEGVDTSTPAAVESDAVFVSIDVGNFHSCALDDAGAAYCWGLNDQGQIGDASNEERDVPVLVADGHVFTEIAVGGAHACGIVSQAEAYCWGDDSFGQLGKTQPMATNRPVPVVLELKGDQLIRPVTITAGAGHTCVLDNQTAPFCWGNNGTGQLGDGTTTGRAIPTPTLGAGIFDFVTISAGTSHTCAAAGGQAHCWGFNLFGQLGDSTNVDADRPSIPVSIDVALPVISAGADHTCGVTADGVGYCWGFNGSGRLGDGTQTDRNVPTPIAGDLALVDVSAGILHTCAVTTDGDVYCWGQNDEGQLGIGGTEASVVPALVPRSTLAAPR